MNKQLKLSRRSFLTIGLGLGGALLASPPSAFAKASLYTTSDGFYEAGNAINGLVTIGDKTYGYKAGEIQSGVQQINDNWYHFDEFTSALTKGKIKSSASESLIYLSDNTTGVLKNTGWNVTGEFTDGNLQRYWVDESTRACVIGKSSDGYAHLTLNEGYVLRGSQKVNDQYCIYADNGGQLLESFGFGPGWLVTSKYRDYGLQRYYLEKLDGQDCLATPTGFFTVDGAEYYTIPDKGYVLRGTLFIESEKLYVTADNEGKITSKVPALNLGGWDFTDWGYVEEMKAYAEQDGSDTDWYVASDWRGEAVGGNKTTLFKRINGIWVPVAGWYCGVGRRNYTNNLPRGSAGVHTISRKWPNVNGLGKFMDYIEAYKGGVISASTCESAGFHAGMPNNGMWGYRTHSCVSITSPRMHWMYDNVPLGTRMRLIGETAGYGSVTADSNLKPGETWSPGVNDPFGLDGNIPS